MDIKKSFLIKLLSGCLIGVYIPVVIVLCAEGPQYIDSHGLEMLRQIVGSMIYGGIAMGSSVFYEIESWGIVRATSSHYLLTMSSFLVANYVLGWFGTGVVLIITFVCMTVAYIIIWLIQYSTYKRQIREINKELEMLRRK
jgi:Flp pilus assembly protein TadB